MTTFAQHPSSRCLCQTSSVCACVCLPVWHYAHCLSVLGDPSHLSRRYPASPACVRSLLGSPKPLTAPNGYALPPATTLHGRRQVTVAAQVSRSRVTAGAACTMRRRVWAGAIRLDDCTRRAGERGPLARSIGFQPKVLPVVSRRWPRRQAAGGRCLAVTGPVAHLGADCSASLSARCHFAERSVLSPCRVRIRTSEVGAVRISGGSRRRMRPPHRSGSFGFLGNRVSSLVVVRRSVVRAEQTRAAATTELRPRVASSERRAEPETETDSRPIICVRPVALSLSLSLSLALSLSSGAVAIAAAAGSGRKRSGRSIIGRISERASERARSSLIQRSEHNEPHSELRACYCWQRQWAQRRPLASTWRARGTRTVGEH